MCPWYFPCSDAIKEHVNSVKYFRLLSVATVTASEFNKRIYLKPFLFADNFEFNEKFVTIFCYRCRCYYFPIILISELKKNNNISCIYL